MRLRNRAIRVAARHIWNSFRNSAITGEQRVGEYVAAVWRCRYFWLSLVKMDLETRYRRSVLGLGWSLLHPIALTIILYTVFHTLFLADVPNYALYVLTGLVLWNYLTSVTIQGCQCFIQAESYIRQYPSPLVI